MNCPLWITHHAPGASCTWFFLTLTMTNLGRHHYYFPHFTDEGTEVPKGSVICLGLTSSKR